MLIFRSLRMYEGCAPCDELSTARPAPSDKVSRPLAPSAGSAPLAPDMKSAAGIGAGTNPATMGLTSLTPMPPEWQQSRITSSRRGVSALTAAAKSSARRARGGIGPGRMSYGIK